MSIRSSRLRLQKIDNDFRQYFQNFEPLWYSVWVCPHCFYSDFSTDFNRVSEAAKKSILDESGMIKQNLDFKFTTPREINQVFTAYYLALHWAQTTMSDVAKAARIWLRLSWLYQDVNDEPLFRMASAKALQSYKETYYSNRQGISMEQDQRMALLLGELSIRNGEYQEAARHFRSAIVHKGGNHHINQQARDRIMDLKDVIANQENEYTLEE